MHVLEELDQLQPSSDRPERPQGRSREKKMFTKASFIQKSSQLSSCIICGDEGHAGLLFNCKAFKKLNPPGKQAQLKKAGVCLKCLHLHEEGGSCTQKFLCSKEDCRKDGSSDHNYLLCPMPDKKD